MNIVPENFAVLHLVGHPLSSGERGIARAALAADEAFFAHTAVCPDCRHALCQQARHLMEQAAKLRSVALGHDTGLAELDAIMRTAAAIVRDIVQIASAGRLDHDAQTAFQCWISQALLLQPTTRQIDRLCRAAGFAGPVDVETMQSRLDELHATISSLRHELSQCATQRAALLNAGQNIVNHWTQGDLALAVRRLATLLPQPQAMHDETASRE